MTAAIASATCDDLARLATHDDRAAWSRLAERHGGDLRRVALRVCGDTHLADDAVAEALLQIRAGAKRFTPVSTGDPEAAAGAWLRLIARRCTLELIRRDSRRRAREQLAAPSAAGVSDSDAHDAIDLAAVSAHHQPGLGATELRAALAELPDSQRQALILHHLEGRDFQAVAEELGCTPGAARVRAHRGLQRLRRRLTATAPAVGLAVLAGSLNQLGAATSVPATLAAPSLPTATTAGLAGHLVLGGTAPMTIIATITGLALATTASLTLSFLPAAEREPTRTEAATEAPVEAPNGQVTGLVVDADYQGTFSIMVAGQQLHLRPRWRGGNPNDGGGLEPDVLAVVRELTPGARVVVTLIEEEGPRAAAIRILNPGQAHGQLTGTIAELNRRKGVVVLESDQGLRVRLTPHWRGGMPADGAGLDQAIIEAVSQFAAGDRVTIDWAFEERYRIERIVATR